MLTRNGIPEFWLLVGAKPRHDTPDTCRKEKLREEISVVTTVYENWDTIVENLTMPSMAALDPREFSIQQLIGASGRETTN